MWKVPAGYISHRFAHCSCQIPTENSGTPWSLGGCILPEELSLGSNICYSGGEASGDAETMAFCQVDAITGAIGSSSDSVLPAKVCTRHWLPALSSSLPVLPYVYVGNGNHAPGHALTLSAALWELCVYKNFLQLRDQHRKWWTIELWKDYDFPMLHCSFPAAHRAFSAASDTSRAWASCFLSDGLEKDPICTMLQAMVLAFSTRCYRFHRNKRH